MLSISHGLTGAFIASKIHNPILVIPLIFISHYIEDWIPHWDVGTGLSTGKRKKSTAIKLELVELVITLGLVWAFTYVAAPAPAWHIWWGLFVALVPDFMEAPRNFLKWEPGFLKAFNNLHGQFHHSTPNMLLGLLPQVVVVAIIFWLG
jgi:hypothetical protein